MSSLRVSLISIKNALKTALEYLPDFDQMNPFQKGTVIDLTFKSVLKDLMNQFKMEPGVDYVDNLKDNESATDIATKTEIGKKINQRLNSPDFQKLKDYSILEELFKKNLLFVNIQ